LGVQINEMDRALSCVGERRNAYTVLVRKPEVKRPLEY
jgi:hypothetical protein